MPTLAASSSCSTASNFAQAVRSTPLAAAVLVGIAVYSSVAMASLPAAWLQQRTVDLVVASAPQAPAAPEAVLTPAADEAAIARARRRCATCGIVEAIERVEAEGTTPAAYRFTVRLYNGSTRTNSAASADRWRIGDRVMLIAGAPGTP